MTRPDPDPRPAAPAGIQWRVSGIVVIVAAALLLVIGAGLGRGPTDPLMLAAFGLLALGWILVGLGVWLARRRR